MFLVYDRSEPRLPANPELAPPDEAPSRAPIPAALRALLHARQEDSLVPGAIVPPGMPPGAEEPGAGPSRPIASLLEARYWEQNEFRPPLLWQLRGPFVPEDDQPRRIAPWMFRRSPSDDAAPFGTPAPSAPFIDEPPRDSRSLINRLARRNGTEEWFLAPKTPAPVIVDEPQRRRPLPLLARRTIEEDAWLPGTITPTSYYAQIGLAPSFECTIDLAPTWSCTITLAPGT